jgi:hypothetical protein
MASPKIGAQVRIVESDETGVIIAPVPHTGWINYHEPAQGRIHVFAVLLSTGEVRFFTEAAFELKEEEQPA